MAAVKKHKIKLREVNRQLLCRLCRGYYVDATTVTECLHSFCRSCIITYLEKNSFCPICEVQIHETKPHLNLRLDKTLQDVVYKLVPGLYHNEMKRRREFYAKHPEQVPLVTPEQCGLEERLIFSPEDSISLSLEYLESQDYETDSISSRSSESGGDNQDALSFPQQLGLMKLKNEGKNSRRESQDVQEPSPHPKRYLQCPANVNVSHLKKFIKMKYYLTDKEQVDIIHKRVPLPDHYTLMDVAYIYTWKRSAPMRFFYQISEIKREDKIRAILPALKCDETQTKPAVTNPEKPKIVNESVVKSSETRESNNACKKSEKPIKTESSNKPEKPRIPSAKPATEKPEPSKLVTNEKPKNISDTPQKLPEVSVKINENKNCDKQSSEEKTSENNVKENNIGKTNQDNKEPLVRNESENISKELNKTQACQKRTENELKVKENVLLNPYSGKLESVPLTVPEKPSDASSQLKKEESIPNTNPVKKENPDDKNKAKPDDARKSNVNLLKSFRREKPTPNRDQNVQLKNGTGDSLTITTITKREKNLEKQEANVSIEIKSEKKNCEYDFDSTSPPNKIMSLKEYTKSEQFKNKFGKNVNNWMSFPDFKKNMVKENDGNEDSLKKEKMKAVPSLYRIGTDQNKKLVQKTPNGKVEKPEEKKTSPTIINIKTESQNNKPEIKIEIADTKNEATPKPVKLEKRGEEVCAKKVETDAKKVEEKKVETKNDNGKSKVDNLSPEQTDLLRGLLKRMSNAEKEHDNAKKAKLEGDVEKSEAIDLTKPENNQQKVKSPQSPNEGKTTETKSHDNMVEMLIAAAQKQSIEALLKIPQFSQNLKSAPMQLSPTQGKTFPPNDISQALQYFQALNQNLKNQCDPNFHHAQNVIPFPFFQQNIEVVNSHKRLKKGPDTPPQRKIPKLSPNSELNQVPKDNKKLPSPTLDVKSKSQSPPKTSPSKEDVMALKLKMERTLSKIQAEKDLQDRMMANYKNMPQILQYMNRNPGMMYHIPGAMSPSKINQAKPKSSHSPNSQKSPSSLIPSSSNLPPGTGFFNTEDYTRAVNSNLHPQMTFIEMFRDYIKQQERLNHSIKPEKEQKVPGKGSPTNSNNGIYVAAAHEGKKQPEHSPIPNPQKT